jgi:hypothetical protein
MKTPTNLSPRPSQGDNGPGSNLEELLRRDLEAWLLAKAAIAKAKGMA